MRTAFTENAIADPSEDGLIDAVDIQLVINDALGLNTGRNTDVNNDAKVDAVDVQL